MEAAGTGNVYVIAIEGLEKVVLCRDTEPVLSGLQRQGIAAVPVGCRGGGCGVCKVQVVEGRYRVGKMSRRHINEEQERLGYVLACRLYPEGPLTLNLSNLDLKKN